jgi:hypothetical protein
MRGINACGADWKPALKGGSARVVWTGLSPSMVNVIG